MKHRIGSNAGVSLVELLVAIGVGLFLVGGAVQLFVGHMAANRRLVLATRVQQDLQVAADLLGRSLRRAGFIDASGPFATDWRLSNGSIDMKLAKGNWQSLTDAETLFVTRLDIVATPRVYTLGALCTPACLATDGSCPAVTVRSHDITIEAHATADASVTRQMRLSVRARNDEATGDCP